MEDREVRAYFWVLFVLSFVSLGAMAFEGLLFVFLFGMASGVPNIATPPFHAAFDFRHICLVVLMVPTVGLTTAWLALAKRWRKVLLCSVATILLWFIGSLGFALLGTA
jgi:hypothetical protein